MKDWTREILIQKYGALKSKSVTAQEQQPEDIYKAAAAFPAIGDYSTLADWIKAVVAATADWPASIRSAVVAEQLKKHRMR